MNQECWIKVLVSFAAVGALYGCGGGGDSAEPSAPGPVAGAPVTPPVSPPPTGTPAPAPGAPAPAPGPSAPTAGCRASMLDDAWMNNRLGCLTVGQTVIVSTSVINATGTPADYAFVVRQRILDANINNVLGGDVGRHFARYMCVRNLPASAASGATADQLARDLHIAAGLRTPSLTPSGYTSQLEVRSSTGVTAVVQEACDPTKHPVILDFGSRAVESINVEALARLNVFDAQ